MTQITGSQPSAVESFQDVMLREGTSKAEPETEFSRAFKKFYGQIANKAGPDHPVAAGTDATSKSSNVDDTPSDVAPLPQGQRTVIAEIPPGLDNIRFE